MQTSRHENKEVFTVSGQKRVRVVIEFDLDPKGGDTLAMKNAMDYMTYYLNTNPRQHKAWGYGIEVQYDVDKD